MKKLLFLLLFPAIAFSQTTSLTFTPISTDINRPGGGAEQWTARQNTVNIPTAGTNTQRLDAYYRFSWTDLQSYNATTAGGSMDFTKFDQEIQDAIRKGQGFSFGVMLNCCSGPSVGGANLVYPLALHNLMQAEAHKDWNNGGGWYENPNSLNWQAWVRALHQQTNAHIQSGSYQGVAYKNVVKRIDIRIAGDFGEQAVLNNAPDALSRPTGASLDTLANCVVNSYPDIYCTSLIGAFAAGVYGFTPAASGAYFLQLRNNAGPTGWRWDSWGWTDGIYHSALENNTNVVSGYHFDTAIMNRYKYAPVGGEPADLGQAGTFNDLPVRVAQYHAESFGNGNLDQQSNNTTTANNFRAASALAGYKIVVSSGTMTTSISQGSSYNITLQLKNVNGTPAYDSWKMVYEWWNGTTLLQRDTTAFDLKGFFSTSDVAYSSTLTLRTVPAGTGYEVHLKVVDPTGFRIPMPLFITGRLADGGYIIRSGIQVLTSGAIANAGNNQTTSGSSITLNGSGSSGATSYLWTQISGPNTATLGPPATTVSVGATGLITGTYVFQLAINGGSSGQLISQTSVQVSLVSPIANAGNPQTIILPTSSATLNGTGSTGATTYAWTNVSGPNTPTLVTPALASTTVSGLIAGFYTFQLSINSGASTSQTSVTVLAAPAPSASAGPSQTITLPTSSVTVSGAGSTGTITSYAWNTVSGPNTPTYGTPTSVSTTISNLIQGVYVIRLTLNGGTAVDTLQIVVNPAIPPSNSITTIFTTQAPTYGTQNGNVHTALTVGVKFRSTSAGYITGIRYYREVGNNAGVTGLLYSSAGTLLASAVFDIAISNGGGYGWRTVQFQTPIAITANTTYVAAVFNSNEFYSATRSQLNNAIVNGPLTALANGFDGANGVYIYNSVATFPTNSGAGTNYWVDAVFASLQPGQLINVYYKAAP